MIFVLGASWFRFRFPGYPWARLRFLEVSWARVRCSGIRVLSHEQLTGSSHVRPTYRQFSLKVCSLMVGPVRAQLFVHSSDSVTACSTASGVL